MNMNMYKSMDMNMNTSKNMNLNMSMNEQFFNCSWFYF